MKALLISLITSITFIIAGCSTNNIQALPQDMFNNQIIFNPTTATTYEDILMNYNNLYKAYLNNQNILNTLENMNK